MKDVYTFLEAIKQHIPPKNTHILGVVADLKSTAAYTAPERHENLRHKIYHELIVPCIAPNDSEPWTSPIQTLWNDFVTARTPPAPRSESPETTETACAESRPAADGPPCGPPPERVEETLLF